MPKGTIAIIGDSIINGIMEEKFCGKGRNVKVRHFPASNVDDMNHHIVPILRKKPSHLIIHVGTNDAPSPTSREILNSRILILIVTSGYQHHACGWIEGNKL